ncbi:uncharacterized protein [Ambystoma mexicanum]|uniref:uncharacterized protein n=1 Tax=Ambystoma mexicanum TaxID=8296 RepID=UPI0037E7AFCE
MAEVLRRGKKFSNYNLKKKNEMGVDDISSPLDTAPPSATIEEDFEVNLNSITDVSLEKIASLGTMPGLFNSGNRVEDMVMNPQAGGDVKTSFPVSKEGLKEIESLCLSSVSYSSKPSTPPAGRENYVTVDSKFEVHVEIEQDPLKATCSKMNMSMSTSRESKSPPMTQNEMAIKKTQGSISVKEANKLSLRGWGIEEPTPDLSLEREANNNEMGIVSPGCHPADFSMLAPAIEMELGKRIRLSYEPSTPVNKSKHGMENVFLFNNLPSYSYSVPHQSNVQKETRPLGGISVHRKPSAGVPISQSMSSPDSEKLLPLDFLPFPGPEMTDVSQSELNESLSPKPISQAIHVPEIEKNCDEEYQQCLETFPVLTRILNLLDKGHVQTHEELKILQIQMIDLITKQSKMEGMLLSCNMLSSLCHKKGETFNPHNIATQTESCNMFTSLGQKKEEITHFHNIATQTKSFAEAVSEGSQFRSGPMNSTALSIKKPVDVNASNIASLTVLVSELATNLKALLAPVTNVHSPGGDEKNDPCSDSPSPLVDLIDPCEESLELNPTEEKICIVSQEAAILSFPQTKKQRRAQARAEKRNLPTKKMKGNLEKKQKNQRCEKIDKHNTHMRDICNLSGGDTIIDLNQLNDESKAMLNLPEPTQTVPAIQKKAFGPKKVLETNKEGAADVCQVSKESKRVISNIKKEDVCRDDCLVNVNLVPISRVSLSSQKQATLSNFYPLLDSKKTEKVIIGLDNGSGAPLNIKREKIKANTSKPTFNTSSVHSDGVKTAAVGTMLGIPPAHVISQEIGQPECNADRLNSLSNSSPAKANLIDIKSASVMGWESNPERYGKTRLNRAFVMTAIQDIPALRIIRSNDIDWVKLADVNNNRMICKFMSPLILKLLWEHKDDLASIGLVTTIFASNEEATNFVEMLSPTAESILPCSNAGDLFNFDAKTMKQFMAFISAIKESSWKDPNNVQVSNSLSRMSES